MAQAVQLAGWGACLAFHGNGLRRRFTVSAHTLTPVESRPNEVDRRGTDEDHTDDCLLDVRVHALHVKPVVEDAQQENAPEGPRERPAPPRRGGAADDHRRDRIEREESPCIRLAGLDTCGNGEAANTRTDTGDDK